MKARTLFLMSLAVLLTQQAVAQTPKVTTDTRFARGATMAFGRIKGSASANGGSAIQKRGFCLSETPEPTAAPGPLTGFVIGLDPGHQLVYDPAREPVAPGSSETKQKVAGGCRGVKSGVYEYEVNLDVSLLLRDMLEEAGATVIMTHEVLDVNISNVQRAQMFNEANVDLGIRIHCNKSDNSKTAGAFMLVPTENRTKFYEENVRAAQVILKAYCAETGLSMRYKDGITYRNDQTGFNWCTRPIINIEMGHLSNPSEDALLSDPAFQVKMARGLFNGRLQYFRPDLVAAANE